MELNNWPKDLGLRHDNQDQILNIFNCELSVLPL